MKYYSKCPVCGSKPSFNIRRKISLDGDNSIEKVQIEEFLIKVAKGKNFEEVLAVCMKCRLVYREKFFDDKELEEIYNELYPRIEEKISGFEGFIYNNEEILNEYSKRIFKMVKDIEKRYHGKITDIYDIGGRDGLIMKDLAQDGYRCTVFDPISYRSCCDKILKKNIWSSQIEDRQTADLILLCSTLEHLVNPQEELIRCNKILRDKGFLYIEVDYDIGSVFRWLLRRGNLGIDITHFTFFSLRSLAYLLKKSGFRCVRKSFYRMPKSDLIMMSILAQKSPSNESYKNLSFEFDLLRSGYLMGLPKRVFKRLHKTILRHER